MKILVTKMKTDGPNLNAGQVENQNKSKRVSRISVNFGGLGYCSPRPEFRLLTLRNTKFIKLWYRQLILYNSDGNRSCKKDKYAEIGNQGKKPKLILKGQWFLTLMLLNQNPQFRMPRKRHIPFRNSLSVHFLHFSKTNQQWLWMV